MIINLGSLKNSTKTVAIASKVLKIHMMLKSCTKKESTGLRACGFFQTMLPFFKLANKNRFGSEIVFKNKNAINCLNLSIST